MAYKRKTWQEKMHPGFAPKVETSQKKFADIPEGATMLIATPEIVAGYIKNIPLGAHTTLPQMRKDLAAEYNAQYCCPITSGIFLRIVAEAAYEEYLGGKTVEQITPFWRIIASASPTAKKLTFGTGFLLEQQRLEGIVFGKK